MLKVRQLFDSESSTYTYIVYDDIALEGVVIDPVFTQAQRDLQLIQDLGLDIKYVCETHIHADHITSCGKLAEHLKAEVVISQNANIENPLIAANANSLQFGSQSLDIIHTPGHTPTCICFYAQGYVFTGDTLLIRKCGRTDFQGGSSAELFKSVHERLFALPDDTTVYPGHDYTGQTSSTIGEEKKYNKRLNLSISQAQFVGIMESLNLPYPKRMDEAVPANLKLGMV